MGAAGCGRAGRLARELLSDRLPEQRHLYVKQDIALTAPFAVKVVCNSAQGDAESQEKLKATVDGILIECFAECDKSLNNFNPASEVSQINNSLPVGQVHKMSPPLATVMKCVEEVHRSSGGAFDPACAPVLYFSQ